MHRWIVLFTSGCDFFFPLTGPSADAALTDAVVDTRGDAGGLDGPGVDVPAAFTCPPGYDLTLLSTSTSRYRLSNGTQVFGTNAAGGAANNCADDSSGGGGFTHLIVLDSDQELEVLVAFNTETRWIGLRRPSVGQPFRPISVQPTAFPPQSGAPWAVTEPSANLCAALDSPTGKLVAIPCTQAHEFICECDAFAPDVQL